MGLGYPPSQGGGGQTPVQIRDALQTLVTTDRLDASAIKNIPTIAGLSSWQVTSGNMVAAHGDRIRVDASSGDIVITLPVSPSSLGADIWIQRLDQTPGTKVLLRAGEARFNLVDGQDGVFSPASRQSIEVVSYINPTIGWLAQHNRLTFQPFTPATYNVPLTYSTNGDTNGLFYYLGTTKGTTAWTNPFPQLAYSKAAGSGTFDNYDTMTNRILNAHPGNTWLDASPYLQVDLGANNAIIPNYVSIRAWINNDRLPRNFKIQGSNNGTAFTDLLTVTANTSIALGGQWLSVPIPGVITPYRYLRYTAFGAGSSNGVLEVALGEWEFYGTVTS